MSTEGLHRQKIDTYKSFIHRDMDPQTKRMKSLLSLISHKEYANIIVKHLPHLSDEIAMLSYFNINPIGESRLTLISPSEKKRLMGNRLWWGHLSRLAGDDKDAKTAVIHGIQLGDIFMGGKKAPGSYWLNMVADEAKSNNVVKITDVDGVHIHEIAVYDKPNKPRESYAKKLQRGLAQLGVEMVANLAERATDDHDFSGAEQDKRIPRTGTMREREEVKINAQQLLVQIKQYSTSYYEGCRDFDEVVQKIKTHPTWKDAPYVRVMRKDGKSIRIESDRLEGWGPKKFIEIMELTSAGEFLESNEEQKDDSIPTLRYFDVLGLSHVSKPLTTEQHTHDMSVWIGADNGVGKVFDRKLPMRKGKMGFKVRLFSQDKHTGEPVYFDTTIDRILEMDAAELEQVLDNPHLLRNLIDSKNDLAGIAGEPPMFMVSINDSENSNTRTAMYKYRADRGRAVSHLIFNKKKNTIEIHSSHGPVDGVEAKWMALAAGYSVGTREENVQDSVYEMPHHLSLTGGLKKKKSTKDEVLQKLSSFFRPPGEKEQRAAVDDLMFHDVVSVRQIDFGKYFKPFLKTINSKFQSSLRNKLNVALEEINRQMKKSGSRFLNEIQEISESDKEALIDLLTPEFGISNVLSFASEAVFGKTAVCVQPLRKEHRLSLALTPHVGELVHFLSTPKRTPAEFEPYLRELETKMMEATHQTNLFSKLSIGHIQMLYLAAQGWRKGAEKATTWLQQPLVEATRIRAQVSALGPNTEKKFTHISPFTGEVPSTYSFTSALSGEQYLHTSIAFEGSSISFRQRLTPELFNSFSLDTRKDLINRKATRLVLDRIFGNGESSEQKKHEALMAALDAQNALITYKFKRINEDLNNSQALVRFMESKDWKRYSDGMKLLTLIMMEEKIEDYMHTARNFVQHTASSFTLSKETRITPEMAQNITMELKNQITHQILKEELGK